MADKNKDKKAQAKLIKMLQEEPRRASDLPMFYRRHLLALNRAGKIVCDAKFVWHVVEG